MARIALPATIVVASGCNGLSIGGLTGEDETVETDAPPPSQPPDGPMPADAGHGEPADAGSADGGTTSGDGGTLDASGSLTAATTMPPTTFPPGTGQGPMTSGPSNDTGDDDPTGEPPPPGFADCVSGVGAAACLESEQCFVDDDTNPGAGICLQGGCVDPGQCPTTPGSDDTVVCADVMGDAAAECVLPCPCPVGMTCFMDTLCLWPLHGFSDCMEDPSVCLPGEECLVFDIPPWSVCSTLGCDGDAGACPLPPPGGTAPAACTVDWDTDGVADCTLDCSAGQGCPAGMTCQGGTLCTWPADFDLACAQFDLGSTTGDAVATGSTALADDDFATNCGGAGENDVAFSWTSPASAIYSFSTAGSDFDTVMALREGCDGEEIACNDDAIGAESQITIPVFAGDTVIIVIDAFSGAGNFVLNIN